MSKQVAKHHKRAARNARPMRYGKRVRGGKPAAAKKLSARRKQVLGGTTADQPQAGKAREAYATSAPEAVEVVEIEMVVPDEAMEVNEADLASPENASFDEEESDQGW